MVAATLKTVARGGRLGEYVKSTVDFMYSQVKFRAIYTKLGLDYYSGSID